MSLEGKPWHAPTSVVARNPPLGDVAWSVTLLTRDERTGDWVKTKREPVTAPSWFDARSDAQLREQVELERLEVVMVREEADKT